MLAVVIRKVPSRKGVVAGPSTEGTAGSIPLRIPVVREREEKLDPVFAGCGNHLVETLQAIWARINGRRAVVQSLSRMFKNVAYNPKV